MNAPYTAGPLNGELVLVGEAPGFEEELHGGAFVGKAGQLLTDLLRSAQINRPSCYIDNVFQFRPKNNDLRPYIDFRRSGVKETDVYREQRAALLERLQQTTATMIVVLGRVPCYALLGRHDITKVRGSIYSTNLLGRPTKVLPTIHPSAALREYLFRYWIAHDLKRAQENKDSLESPALERNFILDPTLGTVLDFLRSCHDPPEGFIAYDIETRGQELSHISFARSPTETICIPFMEGPQEYWSPEEELQVMEAIGRLLGDRCVEKVGQNLSFDATFLFSKYGLVAEPLQDTMIAQGILFPDFPKGLDFLTSIYCAGEPYYKDDGKEWFKNPFGDEETFRRYNAMDSAVLMEIWPKQREELERQGNWETYLRQRSLIHPLVYAGDKGIQLDLARLQTEAHACERRIQETQRRLNDLAGEELNVDSSQQIQNYFYVRKRLRPHTKGGQITTNEQALTQIAAKGYEEASLILSLRHERKMLGTYYKMPLDQDNRLRCSFNPVGTMHGRISSSRTLRGTGGNQQNQPSEMSRAMVADPGHILVEQDLAQAENRVVAYAFGVPEMVQAFEDGADIHSMTGALINGVSLKDVTHEIRQDGKKANHSLNYDMSWRSFGLQYQLPPSRAHYIVDAYHQVYPGVREGHARIRYELSQNHRTLVNCFGRRRTFLGRWGHEMFKLAYNFIPQSSVADQMHQNGVLFLYNRQDLFPEAQFLNTVHDSLRYQLPLSIGWRRIVEIVLAIKASLETPLHWHGEDFVIPVDTQLGFTFYKDDMLEWKASKDLSAAVLTEELESYAKESGVLD